MPDVSLPRFRLELIWAFAFCGLLVSSMLLGTALTDHGHPVGCGTGSGCESVLASGWSMWLTIPVSFAAVAVYVLVLTTSRMLGPRVSPSRRRAASWILLALAVMTVGAAAWFVAVQAFIVKQFCMYCLTAHAFGLAMATVIFMSVPVRRREAIGPVIIGLLAVAVLIGGQLAYRPRMPRMLRVELMNGHVALNAAAYPALGNPHAPHVIVSLSDYTCPYCRAMHGDLIQALTRYGDQVAILVLPVPLNSECNPYITETEPVHQAACGLARLALAVWLASPDKFPQYDAWLFEPPAPRSLTEARTEAEALVGAPQLGRALADPRVEEMIRNAVKLHHETSGPDGIYERLPKVLTSHTILSGEPGSASELFEALEKDLGLHAK